jgi:transposase-like protein
MEEKLGRFLATEERVHHKNHQRADNRPENLELILSHSEHMRQHWKDKGGRDPAVVEAIRKAAADPNILMSSLPWSPTTIRQVCLREQIDWKTRRHFGDLLTEKKVREALQGRTTKDAAVLLGVNQQTLYNHFSHLLAKRASPGSLDRHREEILRLSYVERVSREDIAARFGVSRQCVHRSIQRWRREGAKSAVVDLRELPPLKTGPVLGRKELRKVGLSTEQSLVLGESLLADLEKQD